ncbi:MAG: hypothetical protein KJ737_06840 [Proteobacteria bacterium]|nr:hypothetical protein [Pseudomonadota bacterium]
MAVVGPDMEKRAQVRHVSRMLVVGSHLTVPFFSLVLRRGYGLGVMAMSRGGFHEAFFTAARPTGEFGAMGVDGAIKAGFKKELAAIEDETARSQLYNQLVSELYKRGQAMNMASYLEIDAVIDPADTRRWIIQGLKSAPKEAFTRKCSPFRGPLVRTYPLQAPGRPQFRRRVSLSCAAAEEFDGWRTQGAFLTRYFRLCDRLSPTNDFPIS